MSTKVTRKHQPKEFTEEELLNFKNAIQKDLDQYNYLLTSQPTHVRSLKSSDLKVKVECKNCKATRSASLRDIKRKCVKCAPKSKPTNALAIKSIDERIAKLQAKIKILEEEKNLLMVDDRLSLFDLHDSQASDMKKNVVAPKKKIDKIEIYTDDSDVEL